MTIEKHKEIISWFIENPTFNTDGRYYQYWIKHAEYKKASSGGKIIQINDTNINQRWIK